MKVGLRASLRSGPQGSRDLLMAQYYDIVARAVFADRAFLGDEGFDVDVACLQTDQEILARAEVRYDQAALQRKADRNKSVVGLVTRRAIVGRSTANPRICGACSLSDTSLRID